MSRPPSCERIFTSDFACALVQLAQMHLKKEDAAVRPPDVHSCRFPGDDRDTIPAGQKSGSKMGMLKF
jgi:hypothetical protein